MGNVGVSDKHPKICNKLRKFDRTAHCEIEILCLSLTVVGRTRKFYFSIDSETLGKNANEVGKSSFLISCSIRLRSAVLGMVVSFFLLNVAALWYRDERFE